MKELFDRVLRAIPAYLSHVLELLSGPKTFIDRKNLAAPKSGGCRQSATEAYTFLGITLILVLTAESLFLPDQKDYLLTFASHSVQAVFFLVVMVAVLFAIWRIVGGKLSFKTFFIVTCYLSGISTLIFALFALLAGGVLKQMDPEIASRVLSGTVVAGPPDAGILAYAALIGIGFIAVYVWIIVGWGVYRKLNNVSRARSAIALALFTVTLPALMYVQYLIERSSMPAQDRAAAAGASAGDRRSVAAWGTPPVRRKLRPLKLRATTLRPPASIRDCAPTSPDRELARAPPEENSFGRATWTHGAHALALQHTRKVK